MGSTAAALEQSGAAALEQSGVVSETKKEDNHEEEVLNRQHKRKKQARSRQRMLET